MSSHATEQLLQHLHRGGTYGYWWTGNDKRSTWWTVDAPAALPTGRANSYFGVHPTTEIPPTNAKGEAVDAAYVRSQVDSIAAINCLFGEYDAKHFDADDRTNGKALALARIETLAVAPTVVIDSGGGYHCYWLLRETFTLKTDADRQRARRIQAAWVKLVGSDDDAKDLARVLRVPGTRNYKYQAAPAVEIVRADHTRLYDLAELEALLPAAPLTPARAKRATPGADTTPGASSPMVTLSTIATTAQQLQRLSTDRTDRYSDWLAVGMALRELGTIGLELWDTWSQGSSKYHAGACADKWHTLRVDTAGITLASLGHWADGDDTPAAAPVDDLGELDAATLRQRLRDMQQRLDAKIVECDRLDAWRAHTRAVIAQPSKERSPAQKIVALSLHIEMERRVQAGITEPAPILIGTIDKADGTKVVGLADRAGVSHDTFSKALPKLAEAGAIAYTKTRDPKTGHWRVSIAPAGYFEPATWTTTTARNHGGTRVKHCADCGSTALIEQTRVICLDCGCQQGEPHESAVNPNTQDACGDYAPPAPETADTQDASIGTPLSSLYTQDAGCPSPTSSNVAPVVQPPPLRLANAHQLARNSYARPPTS